MEKVEELFVVLTNPENSVNICRMVLMAFGDLGLALVKMGMSSTYIKCVMDMAPLTWYVYIR